MSSLPKQANNKVYRLSQRQIRLENNYLMRITSLEIRKVFDNRVENCKNRVLAYLVNGFSGLGDASIKYGG